MNRPAPLSMSDLAEKSLRMVREAANLVYDTETSGLDWRRNFPVGYVFCDSPANSLYIPVRHGGGGNLDPNVAIPESADEWDNKASDYEKALAKAFKLRAADSGKLTIGHNVKFDCHASANVGIMLGRNLCDTAINEALLNEYSRNFSLAAVAQVHGAPAKKGEVLYKHLSSTFGIPENKETMGHFWRLPGTDPVAVEYAEGDGVTTGIVFVKQRAKLKEEGLERIWDLENRLIWTLFRMERRGIRVDLDYLNNPETGITAIIEAGLEEARRALPEGFNPLSPTQVRAVCESAGRTDWPTTPKGNPSFPEKFLETFDGGQNILVVRKLNNILSSFVTPLQDRHCYKGRVHANLNQLKGDDGGTPARLSCSRPNLQQVPKRNKKLAKLFRKLFIPDEGMLFYEADYSQCEPRLFAHYSGEPALLAGYNSTPFRDVHHVAAQLLGVERDPTAKRMNMGIFTGMFPDTFAVHMGWDIETATKKWNEWFAAFPAIKTLQDAAKKKLKAQGYVNTILGRRGRLESPRYAYRATSKIIQGSNADILKYKMLEIDEFLEAGGDVAHLLMTVHDAFEWQAPDTPEGEEISREMIRIMENVQGDPFNLAVPFIVEYDKGLNWKEATFGPE